LHILVIPESQSSLLWNRARQEKEASYIRVKMTNMQYPSATSYNLLGRDKNEVSFWKKKTGLVCK